MATEIKKLLAMSRKGKHRNELMALMEAASETATVAIAVKPDRAEPSSKVSNADTALCKLTCMTSCCGGLKLLTLPVNFAPGKTAEVLNVTLLSMFRRRWGHSFPSAFITEVPKHTHVEAMAGHVTALMAQTLGLM